MEGHAAATTRERQHGHKKNTARAVQKQKLERFSGKLCTVEMMTTSVAGSKVEECASRATRVQLEMRPGLVPLQPVVPQISVQISSRDRRLTISSSSGPVLLDLSPYTMATIEQQLFEAWGHVRLNPHDPATERRPDYTTAVACSLRRLPSDAAPS